MFTGHSESMINNILKAGFGKITSSLNPLPSPLASVIFVAWDSIFYTNMSNIQTDTHHTNTTNNRPKVYSRSLGTRKSAGMRAYANACHCDIFVANLRV